MGKPRIINNYSETTQKAWRSMVAAKMLWLNDKDNEELRMNYESLRRLVDEMFEKEEN